MFLTISLKKIKYILLGAVLPALIASGLYMGLSTLYPYKYAGLVLEYSSKYGLPPSLVCAVIHTESRFDAGAVSYRGASGLMQITKQTADWGAETIGLAGYSYEKIHDPAINIELGCWYLNRLLKQFKGHRNVALAAYNAGSGNVSKWLKDGRLSPDGETLSKIPFEETKNYIKKIDKSISIYRVYLGLFDGVKE